MQFMRLQRVRQDRVTEQQRTIPRTYWWLNNCLLTTWSIDSLSLCGFFLVMFPVFFSSHEAEMNHFSIDSLVSRAQTIFYLVCSNRKGGKYIWDLHPWKALQVMGKFLRALNLRFSLFFTEVKGVHNSPPTWAEADHVIMCCSQGLKTCCSVHLWICDRARRSNKVERNTSQQFILIHVAIC